MKWIYALLLFACSDLYGQNLVPYFSPKISGKPVVTNVVEESNGNVIFSGYLDYLNGNVSGNLVKTDSKGKADPNFKKVFTNRVIQDFKVLPDGKILVAGLFDFVNGVATGGLVRLLS